MHFKSFCLFIVSMILCFSHFEIIAIQMKGEEMYKIEDQSKKYFIGLGLRTNNDECMFTMPAHKERFINENVFARIPNKVNDNVLALYTDYAGDHTQPYTWILGCEVSSLQEIPEGLVGITISASQYAVFTTEGEFPQGLISAWQEIWSAGLSRSFSTDFEVYKSDFDPQTNPEVQIYIAIE
jgi:predicted transcriptional regulator YdeE